MKNSGLKVNVSPTYLESHSKPYAGEYTWAYKVIIENGGTEVVQLLNRYWQITDSAGRTHEVRGPGVIGEQPILRPGDIFEYTSGTSLGTPSGIMLGSYQMQKKSTGEMFEVEIPAFSLDSPHENITRN